MTTFLDHLQRLHKAQRWATTYQTTPETVAAHCWDVAVIAHMLATINLELGFPVNVPEIVMGALYHDLSEAITGDVLQPTKYANDRILATFRALEGEAEHTIASSLPEHLDILRYFMVHGALPPSSVRIIKQADKLAAYLKAKTEVLRGNTEFQQILEKQEEVITNLADPAVNYFITTFNLIG